MFRSRLEVALDYLTSNPDAVAVVTGGKGGNETYSEAQVAAAWLTQQGVSSQRILLENRSINTRQNLNYAASILQQAGLGPQVVIISDGFHQMRGQLYARRGGLVPTGIPSKTPWGLFPSYWLREQAALCKAVLAE